MKRNRTLAGILAAAVVTLIAPPVIADHPDSAGQKTLKADLLGYEETPSTINSAASGEFKATISDDGTMIAYQVSYQNLSSAVLQSHIHFGRPGLTGGIVLFLCTNLTPPAGVPTPPLCPPAPATVTGMLTAADVIPSGPPPAGQGIDAGAAGFAEMLRAFGAGAAYANVHSTNHPSGEIRGALRSRGPGD